MLRIATQRLYYLVQVAPVFELDRRTIRIKPMRRQPVADHDAAEAQSFKQPICFSRSASRGQADFRIGHDLRVSHAVAVYALLKRWGGGKEDVIGHIRRKPQERGRHSR